MKKIVSIVLALVLVLAIAAPAMAITGYEQSPAVTPAAVAPYSGGISLIDASASGLGILALNSPAANKAYVANEVVYFKVAISTPEKTTMAKYDYTGAELTISSTAASLVTASAYEVVEGKAVTVGTTTVLGYGAVNPLEIKPVINSKTNTITITAEDLFQDYKGYYTPECNFVVIGYGVVKAEGSIVAEIKGGNMQKFLPLEATATLPAAALSTDYYEYYNNNGKLLYLVKEVAGNDVVVINSDAQGNNYYFLFERSAKNEVEGIKYLGSDGNSSHQIYFKTLAQGGVDTFTVQYFDAVKDAKAIAAIKAQLEDIFTYFNFVWEAKGLLLDGHFTQKLNSFYAIDSVDVHLYTGATITVPEPEVEIPQTGDAATTIGFVMVAMAIVAAAAVAYKKVRA